MRQIADRAGGIAVGGIYNHFSSKEEIFRALLEARSPYGRVIEALLGLRGDSGPELIRQAFVGMQGIIAKNARFFGLVMIDMREFEGSTVRALIGGVIPYMIEFGRRVRAAGGMRADIGELVFVRSFAMLLMGYMLTQIIAFSNGQMMLPGIPPDLQQMDDESWAAALIDGFLYGVADQKARDA